MKYGVIVFKNTENIGDDIQSYAAAKLLPKVDYYVEREYIDTFIPKKKEYVKVIMNGWFMHYKYNFLPSPYIDPVFISTHFSSYETYGIKNEFIKNSSDYLKQYAPIGCRDIHTKKVLDSYGIDNYVSGCVTLTLNKFNIEKSKEDYVCCVDLSDDVQTYIDNNSKIKVVKKTHRLDKKQNKKLTYNERFENVEKLLKLYQNAKLVITSRLHCALPCIALGTPVILVRDDKSIYYKDRIDSFLKYLNYYSEEDFLNENFNNLFKFRNNPIDDIKDKLISKIDKEINKNKGDITLLPEIKTFNNIYVKRKQKIDKMLDIIMERQLKLYNDNLNNKSEVDYWKVQYKELEKAKQIELKTSLEQNDNYWKEQYGKLQVDQEKRLRISLEQNDKYWKKEFNDLLKTKEMAVKENDDYWKKEFNSLLEKYNELLNKEN